MRQTTTTPLFLPKPLPGTDDCAAETAPPAYPENERHLPQISCDARQHGRTFQSLFDDAPIAYAEADTKGLITRVNRTLCELTGFSPDEMVGNPVWSFVVARDEEASRLATVRRLSGTEPVLPLERVYSRRDGTELRLLIHWNYVKDDEGTIVGLRAAMLDVTEMRRAEERLRDREETLRTVCDGVLDAIVMIDSAASVILWNPAAERMFGYAASEMIGEPIHDVLAPVGLRPRFAANFPAFQKTGQGPAVGKTMEMTALRRDGSEFPVELALSAVQKEGQWQAVGVIRDVSARKRDAAALLRRTEELARSNAELEQFAYVASHDLQEPLRMVASYTQLLAKRYKGKLGQDADDFIGFAVDGATRMQRLITDLLAYSRVGRKVGEIRPVQAEAALSKALANLEAAIRESGAVIEHGPMPALNADPVQLAQLFQNLLANAIKFRNDGPPEIRVACEERPEVWHFTVTDNGIGIDPKQVERIFLVFQRLHTNKDYPGTGIGLAICKKIAERHGGLIWAESEPGQGSTFHFTVRKECGEKK